MAQAQTLLTMLDAEIFSIGQLTFLPIDRLETIEIFGDLDWFLLKRKI